MRDRAGLHGGALHPRPGPDLLNAQDSIFVNGGRRSMLALKKTSAGSTGSIAMGVHT